MQAKALQMLDLYIDSRVLVCLGSWVSHSGIGVFSLHAPPYLTMQAWVWAAATYAALCDEPAANILD